VGYFVARDAFEKVKAIIRGEFIQQELERGKVSQKHDLS